MNQVLFNEKYKEVLLDTFKRTIDFLDFHHITWFVTGGTCLGTLRHHGIIPWDDDIDIFVPRDQYEKLFELRDKLAPYSLEMKSIEDGYGYYNGFIKIYDCNTTLWELREFEDVIGIYVDVFPLDRSNIGPEQFTQVRLAYRKAMRRYLDGICHTTFKGYCKLLAGFHLRTIWQRVSASLASHDKAKDYDDFVRSTRQIAYDPNGKHMMCVMGSYDDREFFEADWFADAIEMPFADFTVKVASGYDHYLSQIYGDYMKMPPLERQVTHHFHYYCNFKERLTLEEVKERMKRGETCVV